MEWMRSLLSWYGFFILLSLLTLFSRRRIIRWLGGLLTGVVAIIAFTEWVFSLPQIVTTISDAAYRHAEQSLTASVQPLLNRVREVLQMQPLPIPRVRVPDYTGMIFNPPLRAAILALFGFILRAVWEILRELRRNKWWKYLWEES